MHMKVEYGLAAIGVRIDHDPVSIAGETLALCDIGRRQKQMAESLLMPRGSLVHRIDVLARDDENMGRRLRRNVVERQAKIVFINSLRRYVAGSDLTKDAIGHR